MSREIKFNAVDEETGEYVRFDDFIKSLKEPNGFGYIEFRDDDTPNELLAKFLSYYHGYKLLQYTGMRDKNGVEIYEGDLIKGKFKHFKNKEKITTWYGPVFFKGSSFDIDFIEGEHSNCLSNKMCFGLEVVGNIYE